MKKIIHFVESTVKMFVLAHKGTIRMNLPECIVLKNIEGLYSRKEKIIIGNNYLMMIISIFDEGGGWTKTVKRELLNPQSQGITGNRVEVDIQQNKVVIRDVCFDDDDTEDNAIEIDRQVLLDLINQWQDLVQKEAQEIVFTRHDDGSITVTGTFEKR